MKSGQNAGLAEAGDVLPVCISPRGLSTRCSVRSEDKISSTTARWSSGACSAAFSCALAREDLGQNIHAKKEIKPAASSAQFSAGGMATVAKVTLPAVPKRMLPKPCEKNPTTEL